MEPSARIATGHTAGIVVVSACAASAGAHAGLVPSHLEHQPALGASFAAAAILALAVAGGLTLRPSSAPLACLAILLLTTLIAAYALSVTVGVPWLADEAEAVDAVGLATKAVEALGLVFALQLIPTWASTARSLTRRPDHA